MAFTLDIETMAKEYRAGSSILDLSIRHRAGTKRIREALEEHGVEIRRRGAKPGVSTPKVSHRYVRGMR